MNDFTTALQATRTLYVVASETTKQANTRRGISATQIAKEKKAAAKVVELILGRKVTDEERKELEEALN